jgi:acyl dehydratase
MLRKGAIILIDEESAIGLSVEQKWTYDWRDVILYALSVGADSNVRPEEIEYTWEKRLKVIPAFTSMTMGATFGADPNTGGPFLPTHLLEEWPAAGVLHMTQDVRIFKPMDPQGGTLTSTKTIKHLYDRGEGKGAKVVIEIASKDEGGDLVCVNEVGIFNRFLGGFGGSRPPKSNVTIPDRDPDWTYEGSTDPRCNELFRLTGDVFDLHIDPEFAKKAGFPRCITHGLCNYGYANRILVDEYLPVEPERMKSFGVEFRSVAFPGDLFRIQSWKVSDSSIVFRMIDAETGKATLDKGYMSW